MSIDPVIGVYGNGDALPAAAEELFKTELGSSRQAGAGAGQWRFLTLCVADASGRVLGGAHLDIGPIEFGPLAEERLAYLEAIVVLPEHRRQGLGAALLIQAAEEAGAAGCNHIRFNVSWDNPAMIAACRRAGFALTCLDDGEYFVVRPTAALECRA